MSGHPRGSPMRGGFNQRGAAPLRGRGRRGGYTDRGGYVARGSHMDRHQPSCSFEDYGEIDDSRDRRSFERDDHDFHGYREYRRNVNHHDEFPREHGFYARNEQETRKREQSSDMLEFSDGNGSKNKRLAGSSQGNIENGAEAAEVLPPATPLNVNDDDPLMVWRDEYEPHHDKPGSVVKTSSRRSKFLEDSVEECITSSLTHMGLERSPAVLVTANTPAESTCFVATPLMALTRHTRRRIATMDSLDGELKQAEDYSRLVSLEPTIKEVLFTEEGALAYPTSTLAEVFIQHPQKAWLNNGTIQLKAESVRCDKLLIWARALLVSKDDRDILSRAGITRGILGLLYEVPLNWPLVQAFLSFWNSEGHTLVTSQGEMGFPLLVLQDSMGIPISGRVYDEYVPESCFQDELSAVLFSAYASIRKNKIESDNGGDGLVTLDEWVNHFLYDMTEVENSPKIPLPPNFYADVDDPLLEKLNFRMSGDSGKAMPPGIYFSNQVMRFNGNYSRTQLRAAFVAAWLCSYCVPVGMGTLIRPEVFMAAATIAKGVRRAIGIASMAYLYESLDAIQGAVCRGTRSASKCRLSLPVHFIMGWFACYWRAMPAEPTSFTYVTNFPPFIADIWRASEININLESAHRLFLDIDVRQHCLAHLDFLGRLKIRFPEAMPNLIVDRRHASDNTRQIRMSEVDLLVSTSVGGVSHRRCHIYNNQPYCPQRFARMFNCDQVVPDISMDGLLQFSDRLSGNINETTEMLQRRLLAYWLPNGHTFEAQIHGRVPACSAGYFLWCKSYLGFLKDALSFCVGATSSSPKSKDKAILQERDAYTMACEFVKNGKASLKGGAETGACSRDSQPLVVDTPKEVQSVELDETELEVAINGQKPARRVKDGGCTTDMQPTILDGQGKATFVDLTSDNPPVATNEQQPEIERDMFDEDSPSTVVALEEEGKARANTKPGDLKPSTSKRKKSDAQIGTEGTKPQNKKARMSKTKQINAWNATTSKVAIEKLSSYIKPRVEAFKMNAVDFNTKFPAFVPAQDKYDGVSGVVLRASDITDETQRDFFLYAKQDLQILQSIASATVLDKSMLAERINKVLARWTKLFSAQISEGMGKMVAALGDLKELLEGNAIPPSFDTKGMATHRSQIKEVLEEAAAIQEAIDAAFVELDGIEAIAKLKREALATTRGQQEKKIADLKASLALAEEKLQETQGQEAEIENFFKDSEEAREDFHNLSVTVKKKVDRGELAMTEADKHMEYIGDDSSSSQPKPVRSLLAFVQSSSCEE